LVLLAGGVRLNSKHYRPDIDGLRAVAVVGVVAFHAYPFQVPGGFVGVDIFFVISGFLITSIITKEMEERTFSFATFYARRARRIFPALAVVLVTLLGAGWFLLLADEYAAVGKHTAAGAGLAGRPIPRVAMDRWCLSSGIARLLLLVDTAEWLRGVFSSFSALLGTDGGCPSSPRSVWPARKPPHQHRRFA